MEEIVAGSVVRLKSGGPKMTVQHVAGSQAWCERFVKGHRYDGKFEIHSLVLVSEPEVPTLVSVPVTPVW